MDYKMRHEHGEPVQCDSCDFPAPTAEFDWGPPFTKPRARPHRMLCEFCATSMAGRHTENLGPDDYGHLRADIWRAAAAVYNMLRQAKEG